VSALAKVGELAELDLTGLVQAIAGGEVSAAEVVQHTADRAARLQPNLNCFVAMDFDRALDAAKRADAMQGDKRGPLHGVPVAHKDMYYRAGQVATGGTKIRRDFRPDYTATVLERLDRAGAIEIGTLNMAEFALYPTGHNAHYGDCRNPWDTGRITGGSSSGSGAAIAARLCWGSLGSDSGGSVRIPSAFCGVSGLKPTAGRVSRYGIMPLAHSLDYVGPLTQSVRDIAKLLGVIAGADGKDHTASDLPVADYEAGLGLGLKGLRIGVVRHYFFDGAAPDLVRALDGALDVLRGLGAEIVELDMPEAELCATYAYFALFGEFSSIHVPWLRTRLADYGPMARNRLLRGLAVPAARYHEAMTRRGPLLKSVLDGAFVHADLLLTPTTNLVAPTFEEADESSAESRALLGKIARNTRIFNYLGLPALSIPCGFAERGLPVAMQLVGKPFGEARLLRAGHAYQEVTDWHRRMPAAKTSRAA
jgi:aspartyl-tRNA(Asn)/glutamyl-tRNA(Gln) amidotransferase subunit A